MYSHAHQNYQCPFCRIILQDSQASGVAYSSDTVTAFLGPGRWMHNPADVLIAPNTHFENIFDLPVEYVPDLHKLARAVAFSMKAVHRCDGISTRQHNEPAGDRERLEHARSMRELLQEHAAELI